MKLIYIATSVIPAQKANSYQVMKMCEAFSREGADVELLIPVRFGGVREKGEPFEYYGVDKCFKIRKIFSIDLIPLEKIIGHLGFWIQNASFSLLTLIYVLFASADIIYSRDRFTLLFLCLFKKNLVYEVHSLPAKFRWYEKFLYRRVKKIVLITKQMKRILREHKFVLADKIFVAPDAVDLKMFNEVTDSKEKLRQELKLPQDKKLIAYIGKLRTKAREKGVADIIRAFKVLKEKGDNENVMVFVGGDVESVRQYRALILELGLKKEDAIFIKHVPFSEVPKYEKAMDVLIMPFPWAKHYAYYMSPLKMFEYMASGVPIVTTDLPSVREVLGETSTIFAEPGEPESLARGISKVLNDRETANGLAEKSKNLVKNYTWQKRAERILKFIKKEGDLSLEVEMIRKINEIYHDKEAEFYDKFHQGIMEQERSHWEKQKKYFRQEQPVTVLDIGTGTGLVPCLVAKWLSEEDVIICNDISYKMLEKAREKLDYLKVKPVIKLLKTPADETGLASGSIDIITLNSVLHHLPDAENFFKEASRILKKDGLVIIFHEPNRRYFKSKFLIFLNKMFNKSYSIFRKEGIGSHQYEEFYEAVREEMGKRGLLERELSNKEIMQIVDFHSPTAGGARDKSKGFDVDNILQNLEGKYDLELFFTYGHLGKRSYPQTFFVNLIEFILQQLMPKSGGAFGLILRKK